MNYKKMYLILGILSILSVVTGGTFGYYKWATKENEKTEIDFSFSERFTCLIDGGGDITSNDISLVPTICDNTDNVIKKEITFNSEMLYDDDYYLSLDLWLDINDLGSGLSQSENFMWMLSRSSNGCIDAGVMKYGSFNGKTENDKVHLLENYIYKPPVSNGKLYLYIWLDGKQKSNITMNQTFSLSLNGSCTSVSKGDSFYAVYSADDTSLRFYKEDEGVIVEGQQYEGRIATNVYKAYENDVYAFVSSTKGSTAPWDVVRDNVTTIVVEDEIKPSNLRYWFSGFQNVMNVDVTNLNTENATNIEHMFYKVGYNVTESFTITGLDNWNTKKVTDMNGLFRDTGYNATSFNIGDLSNWDTSSVVNIVGAFFETGYRASTFNIGNLGLWDLSNVTNMYALFYLTGYSATTFNIGDLSNWDTSNVIDMEQLFGRPGFNATIWSIGDLSNWDVSNVINMDSMFNGAGYSASTFDIGNLDNWNTKKVTSMRNMFGLAGHNATTFNIGNLSNWDTSNVIEMRTMFNKTGYTATNWSLDLSGWNVNKVINYADFNTNVSNKVTAPNWVN